MKDGWVREEFNSFSPLRIEFCFFAGSQQYVKKT